MNAVAGVGRQGDVGEGGEGGAGGVDGPDAAVASADTRMNPAPTAWADRELA
jgi:hypothetical protein